MIRFYYIRLLILILLAGCKSTQDNMHLTQMATDDQQDRIQNNPRESANDEQRLLAVKELVEKDALKTARDYFNAAIILQHGHTPEDYLLANTLAKKAVQKNKNIPEAKLLIAQSQDRYLRRLGKPQWYGTQRITYQGKEYLQAIDTTKVSDKERLAMGVRTLKQKLDYYNKMHGKNAQNLTEYMVSDETIAKWQAEIKAELVGTYEDLFKQLKYPAAAKAKNLTGSVLLEFTVDAAGQVKDAVVVKGLGSGCDEEALRIIQLATYKNYTGADHYIRLKVPFGNN